MNRTERFLWAVILIGLPIAALFFGWQFGAFDKRFLPPLPTKEEQTRSAALWAADQRMREQEAQERREYDLYLCRMKDACSKYDRVRLECAVAGDFRTCLRIKMGDDVHFVDVCSGYNAGGPAVPLDPQSPDAVRCFVLKTGGFQ
jgi:hypothetical protein